MNKKLVAAAIAAALAAPAAYADVTIYGKIHMSVDFVDEDGAGGWDGQTIADRDSRIGFKGTEDLGNGMKAVWKYETSVDFDTSSGTYGSRDAYLGLATNYGTFLAAGGVNTPYKSAFGKYDFFADTLADWDQSIGMEDNRASNALVYISPSFSGLSFAGAIVAGEGAEANDSLADAYSLSLSYSAGGLMAAIAYEDMADVNNALSGNQADTKWRVGLGYKMDAFAVAATFEDASDYESVAGADATRWTIQGSFAMGNNKIKAMYGNEDHDVNGESDAWAVGVDHSMSKRTSVYALYVDSDRQLRAPSESHYGTSSDPALGASGFSVGMVHSF